MRRTSTTRTAMAFLLAVAMGCASTAKATAGERLFFALEMTESGRAVGRPQLLGNEGHTIFAERKGSAAERPDYRLKLMPEASNGGYQLALEIDLASGKHASGNLQLLHGEERKVLLSDGFELKVMMMRVDSPEFEAFMKLPPAAMRGSI